MCQCTYALDYAQLKRISDFNVGTWVIGDGNVNMTTTVCGASADTDNRNATEPPDTRYPYSFRMRDRGTPPGHYLYLNDDDTQTGNARIQMMFNHRDALEPTAYEALPDNVYDGHAHLGQFKNCKNGVNCEIQLLINSSEMERAQAGDYTGNFRATLMGGTSGTNKKSKNFVATVTIADIVQISGLNIVDLGSYAGAPGDLVQESFFCVYSNNSLAGYNVLISSSYQDAGGNFFIKDAAQTKSIPYGLQFKDDTLPGGGTSVGLTAISGIGDNTDANCSGTDNAKLTVTILDADLQASSADSYDDTLILLVSPE